MRFELKKNRYWSTKISFEIWYFDNVLAKYNNNKTRKDVEVIELLKIVI